MTITAEEQSKLQILMTNLGYQFQNLELLAQALTHRSYLNEVKTEFLEHNERLEFLGDAVLELVITEYLFRTYIERSEGELTSFRAAVVRTESLAQTSLQLEVGEYIFMSKGEAATGGRTRPYILANAFEALLGAIYIDGGMESFKALVDTLLVPKFIPIIANRLDIDSKSRLQELAQEVHKFTPIYKLLHEEGPDHERTFTVEVIVNNESFGQGKGRTKQEAEQAAASEGLIRLESGIIQK